MLYLAGAAPQFHRLIPPPLVGQFDSRAVAFRFDFLKSQNATALRVNEIQAVVPQAVPGR